MGKEYFSGYYSGWYVDTTGWDGSSDNGDYNHHRYYGRDTMDLGVPCVFRTESDRIVSRLRFIRFSKGCGIVAMIAPRLWVATAARQRYEP